LDSAAAGDASGGLWVLAGGDPVRVLGPALALARSSSPAPDDPSSWPALNVLVDSPNGEAGTVARRATQFASPPAVWAVQGRSVEPAPPSPLPPVPALDQRVVPFLDVLVAAGADPVVEHGRLVGEVLGLEVARVEIGDDGPYLAVGVGRFDREAHAVVSADVEPAETLRRVVEQVRLHRQDGAEPHPLGRLAAARRLRARIVADPGLVGADHLAPSPNLIEPPDLRTAWPAPASGTAADGTPMVVVCSVGIDLDLVPAAADLRLAADLDLGADHDLVLALADRDVHAVTLALAAALTRPARIARV
jgi:hypothetical protein